MEVLSYSVFRQTLASVLDKVNDDSVPVQITRKGGRGAIVMSIDDFESMEETIYILQNKSLSTQIEKSMETYNKGAGRKANQEVMDEILGS